MQYVPDPSKNTNNVVNHDIDMRQPQNQVYQQLCNVRPQQFISFLFEFMFTLPSFQTQLLSQDMHSLFNQLKNKINFTRKISTKNSRHESTSPYQ